MNSATTPTPPADKFIQVRGARQHNLRNVDVDVPRERMTVITGLSGSGKSSLAFDTIFAEGQRRYVESLSLAARQHLDQLPRPDADRIDGLCPTIAIEQHTAAASPRSTVATTTELYDFLRVLYARVGTPTCWVCGRSISRQSVTFIVDELLERAAGRRALILAPVVYQQRGGHADLLAQALRQGFVRARINGQLHHLEELAPLQPRREQTIELVVDRLRIDRDARTRIADSVELAVRTGRNRVIVAVVDETAGAPAGSATEDLPFSTQYTCAHHPEVQLAELSPRLFNFNAPFGACPSCHGLGTRLEFDPDLLMPDRSVSLADGAIVALRGGRQGGELPSLVAQFRALYDVPPAVAVRDLGPERERLLLHGGPPPRGGAKPSASGAFPGLIPFLQQRWATTDSDKVKQRLHGFQSEAACAACGSGRLNPAALAVQLAGRSIADTCRQTVSAARESFAAMTFDSAAETIAAPILHEVRARLQFMCDVGVDYLTLDRGSATLSGGEAQRIRLATQIGSGLAGVCYVLDEPTIGLHQRDSARLIETLRRLTALGNTVIVVEHDEATVAEADHVIDVGPGAGAHGGRIVAEGTLEAVLACDDSLTSAYFRGERWIETPSRRRPVDPRRCVSVHDARANNLKHLTVDFPIGCFTCVTGVSGSGKSTLVADILVRTLKRVINGSGPRPAAHGKVSGTGFVDRVIEIDQAPIGRSPRSNPATYVGVFDHIRELFARTREARVRGYAPARFSFNVKGGRCEECQGQGTRRVEMHFLPDVFVECPACHGARYNRETLEVRYRGMTIADVLALPIEEAATIFENVPKIQRLLAALVDVGLGYMTLGQSSTTLSGGEAQRIKLAAELGKSPTGHTLYVLDEPTSGLHLHDIHNLLGVLNRLVDLGHSMVVIEHQLDVIKMADHVIDLGPEGGEGGGELIVAGRPEEVAACPASHTGRELVRRLTRQPLVNLPTVGRPGETR